MLLWELELAFAQDATMAQLLVANWAEPMAAMSAGNLVALMAQLLVANWAEPMAVMSVENSVALMAVTSVENSVELRDAQ